MTSTHKIQNHVAAATSARGYRQNWTDTQFLIRQIAKLQEELGELAYPVTGMPYINGIPLEYTIDDAATQSRTAFDELCSWKNVAIGGTPDCTIENALAIMKDEAADCLVVLFNIAETLERMTGQPYDVCQAAFEKSHADIQRGVRG